MLAVSIAPVALPFKSPSELHRNDLRASFMIKETLDSKYSHKLHESSMRRKRQEKSLPMKKDREGLKSFIVSGIKRVERAKTSEDERGSRTAEVQRRMKLNRDKKMMSLKSGCKSQLSSSQPVEIQRRSNSQMRLLPFQQLHLHLNNSRQSLRSNLLNPEDMARMMRLQQRKEYNRRLLDRLKRTKFKEMYSQVVEEVNKMMPIEAGNKVIPTELGINKIVLPRRHHPDFQRNLDKLKESAAEIREKWGRKTRMDPRIFSRQLERTQTSPVKPPMAPLARHLTTPLMPQWQSLKYCEIDPWETDTPVSHF